MYSFLGEKIMKTLAALLLFCTVAAGMSFAEHCPLKNNYKKTSVAEALKMNDDERVTIQGNIVSKISNDKYTFKDSTGTMTVDIDNDKWSGIASNTKETLEISGEIEKKLNSTELDVEHVRKVSN